MLESKVLDKRFLTDDILELKFEKVIDFKPGQFIRLYIDNEFREFSLTSIPDDNYLSIISLLTESNYKKKMKNLNPGDKIYIDGPYGGNLSLKENRNVVFIAGGIGITPFLSNIKYIIKHKLDYNVILFYSVRYLKEAIYLDLLKNVKLVLTITRENIPGYENKHIDMDMIKKYVDDIYKYDYYICGSVNFTLSMFRMLKNNGLKNIYLEVFTGYK
ncbi:sulfhydrogenase 2 subunit gamma [Nanoarchaeota archaeon]